MNGIHDAVCSSRWWARRVESKLLPWGIGEVDLGERVLEVGPGFGASTRVLARELRGLEVLELDPRYCERLRAELPESVGVTQGDATAMPYANGQFSGVVCFTMLHHIPSAELQDRAFVEIGRVLRPGGVFAGTDSVGTGFLFRLIHLGDTLMPIGPEELPGRLEAAGFVRPQVSTANGSFRFRATRGSAG